MSTLVVKNIKNEPSSGETTDRYVNSSRQKH